MYFARVFPYIEQLTELTELTVGFVMHACAYLHTLLHINRKNTIYIYIDIYIAIYSKLLRYIAIYSDKWRNMAKDPFTRVLPYKLAIYS